MAMTWEAVKDPDDVKDYSLSWAAELAANSDTINTSTWTVEVGSGLTINSTSKSDTTTTLWLSGGTANVTYELLNRITTAGGRTLDQTMKLKCKNK